MSRGSSIMDSHSKSSSAKWLRGQTRTVRSGDASNATGICRNGWFGGSSALGRKERQVVSDVKLHAVDLSQEPRSRRAVVHWVGFGPAELGYLVLKPGDAFQSPLQLLVVRDHDPSSTISIMPR